MQWNVTTATYKSPVIKLLPFSSYIYLVADLSVKLRPQTLPFLWQVREEGGSGHLHSK